MPTLDDTLKAFVELGEIGGAVALVARPGTPLRQLAVGWRDVSARQPMTTNTIFRIASLTKPVTAVAALCLADEGRFRLDDAITTVAREFEGLRVLPDPDAALDRARPAARPITFRDLLTHRSGFTYGEFHAGPIAEAYASALGPTIDNVLTPDEWCARLATLPLVDEPGAHFHYGVSSDVLGFLIARMDGEPLGDVLRRRVFEPLGMRDTGFAVPPAALPRTAALTGFDDAGQLRTLETPPGGHALAERPAGMTFESGGQGLWSTANDYATFARMLAGGGAVDQVRLLRRETCALMTTNQLTAGQRAAAGMFGQPLFAEGHGYGMGVAVVMEPDRADVLRCRGGVGTVGWPGAYGSWWQMDPNDGSVLVFLTHNMVELQQLARGIGFGAWRAITAFHAHASSVAG